jgi:hypothetical protein
VEDSELVLVGDRGDDQIDEWHAVIPDARELTLRVYRPGLDLLGDVHLREREKLIEQFAVVAGALGGVACYEQKGKGRRDPTGLEQSGYLIGPLLRECTVIESCPGRIVQQ